MIIYKCLLSNDEMFSDIYKIKLVEDGMMFEVEGKTVSRTEGVIEDRLIGGNASAEDAPEANESVSVSGVDIILNHKLQETPMDKKSYMMYIKGYMKSVKAKLEETNSDRVDEFMSKAPVVVKKILANFSNYQFFMGENMNPEAAVGLLDYREDGITPYMLFFKDGLMVEKC